MRANATPKETKTVWALGALLCCALAVGCDEDNPQTQPTTQDPDTGPVADTDPPDTTNAPDTADSPDTNTDTDPLQTYPLMDYGLAAGFFSAPLPDESRRTPEGTIRMDGYPNPTNNDMVNALVTIIGRDLDGFGMMSAVFFPLSGPLDPASLSPWQQSTSPSASAYIIGVDPGKPDFLKRYPATAMFEANAGPYGAENLLSLLPIQGVPLAEQTLYAAVLTDRLRAADGSFLVQSPEMALIRAEVRPDEMSPDTWTAYQAARNALQDAGLLDEVVGLTVFRTGAPTAGLRAAWEQVKGSPLALPATWQADEVFDTFCVFSAEVDVPVFQAGEPPFTRSGGDWRWAPDGTLIQQSTERARIVITLPRAPMPAGGFPLAVFVRTGGGGDRPLPDRGVRGADGLVIEPGSGPARNLAQAQIAGLSIDGPHGGLRNITASDEQFLIFNIQNPVAMRDNIRQSALELALLAESLDALVLDAGSCPGLDTQGQPARFNTANLALMGHSMGATIAPLVLAIQPRYRAAVLSGAGGSWIANIVHKKKPLEVAPLAELVLNYRGRHVHEHDPALSLLQWAGEAADPPVYAPHIIAAPWSGDPRHVLMFQGIADTYILPPMANALALPLGLDATNPVLDADDPVTGQFTSIRDLVALSGAEVIDLPAAQNLKEGQITGAVVQHIQDPIEDGHEVMFQLPSPKHQYRCFLSSLNSGGPATIPASGGGEWDSCP